MAGTVSLLLCCKYVYMLFQGKCFYEMVVLLFQLVFLIMYILFLNNFSKTLRWNTDILFCLILPPGAQKIEKLYHGY